MTGSPILETIGISKSFPGVKALQNVDFGLYPGEIHTLMGQNGAGKSTLINVLTGVHAHDAGEIRLGGEAVNFATPLHAEAAGIRTLYQEVNLARICLSLKTYSRDGNRSGVALSTGRPFMRGPKRRLPT